MLISLPTLFDQQIVRPVHRQCSLRRRATDRTNRIVGGVTASQTASGSAASAPALHIPTDVSSGISRT